MIWLVVRRQRPALALVLGMLVVLSVALIVYRVLFVAAGRARGIEPQCLGSGMSSCPTDVSFVSEFALAGLLLKALLLVAPAAVGIIAGAGLFGRDLDRGTHVLALTQGTSRLRWWASALLVVGIPLAVAVGVLTMIGTWGLQHSEGFFVPVAPIGFETAGVMPAVYALLAFALSAAAGLLLRSTLAAVAVAVVLQVTVQLALPIEVRAHFLPPEVTTYPLGGTGFIGYDDRRTAALGWRVEFGVIDADGRQIPETDVYATMDRVGEVTEFIAHHPPDRFWPLQLIESALVLTLAAAALALSLLGVRRRVL